MQEIKVSASKNYTITVTRGKGELSSRITSILKGKKVAIITDEIVDSIYGDYFEGVLPGIEIVKAVIPSGEKEKCGENYLKLISFLACNEFTRKDAVITFGGGVVGDLGAFVASTYMRGIKLIAMPTTLLSMVDSSVGGKTAIDIPEGKNLCGTFYQPDHVYIDLDLLNSLPQKEMMNGYGEIIKYAFISSKVKPEDIKGEIEDLVVKCLEIKRDIVEQDERESGLRKLLNFGHTVGHAVEKLSDFKLSHGLCVVKGMSVAIDISAKLYSLSEKTVKKMREVLSMLGHDTSISYDLDDIVRVMRSDKKSAGDSVDFVTVRDIATPVIEKIKFDDLRGLIDGI